MTHQQDDTIRRAMQDLRESDANAAPDFDAVQERPAAVYRFDTRRAASVAFAASVLLVTGSVIAIEATKKPTRFEVPAEVIALSTWRPMTDVLLYESAALVPKDSKAGVILSSPTRDSSPE